MNAQQDTVLARIKRLFIPPSPRLWRTKQAQHNSLPSNNKEWMIYEDEAREQFVQLSQKGLSIPVFTV